MRSKLTIKGWIKYHSCYCGGSLKEYYNHPDHKGYEIRLRPGQASFTLLLDNQIIAGPLYIYKLEETLQAYGIAD